MTAVVSEESPMEVGGVFLGNIGTRQWGVGIWLGSGGGGSGSTGEQVKDRDITRKKNWICNGPLRSINLKLFTKEF